MSNETLANAITTHGDDAYLLTVGEAGPHTSFVTVRHAGDRISCHAGNSARTNVARVVDVSLFWPPREEGGYGIVVNGRAEAGADSLTEIRITKAVLHRAGSKPADREGPCPSDCRPLTYG